MWFITWYFIDKSSIPLWRIPWGHVGPVRYESQRSSPSPSPSPNPSHKSLTKLKRKKIKPYTYVKVQSEEILDIWDNISSILLNQRFIFKFNIIWFTFLILINYLSHLIEKIHGVIFVEFSNLEKRDTFFKLSTQDVTTGGERGVAARGNFRKGPDFAPTPLLNLFYTCSLEYFVFVTSGVII